MDSQEGWRAMHPEIGDAIGAAMNTGPAQRERGLAAVSDGELIRLRGVAG